VLLNTIPAFSQETEKEVPLVVILNELQEKFDIHFNYASELVDAIRISKPDGGMDLSQAISFLERSTNLKFEFISDRVVVIRSISQMICGYIKDKDSNEPLVFATIQIGTAGTITNEEGYFQLKISGSSNNMVIRHFGYESKVVAQQLLQENPCGVLYLERADQVLPEIVVSDYLIRGLDKLNNGSIKLDFTKFSILPGQIQEDVFQALQALPGIQSVDETVSNINIRGGSHDQNLILWDGIKMYQSGHFFGMISMFNPQITQKVILRKDGTSAAFSDGVSGTISMLSDADVNSNLNGSIGANLIDVNGFVDVPLGQKVSVQIASRKALSNFFESPTYSEYFNRITRNTEIANNVESVSNSNIVFDFYDMSMRLLYKPSAQEHLRLNFIHTADELVFDENAQINGVQEIKQSGIEQSSIAGGLYYLKQWRPNFATEISIYETDYQLKAVNANIFQVQRFLQTNTVSETGFSALSKVNLSSNLRLDNGYTFTETKITNLDDVDNPIFRRLEGEVVRMHSIFSESHWVSSDTESTLNAGLRLNYIQKFQRFIPEPRFSFNQKLLKVFNLEILGELKHQSTSQIINFQNDFLGIEKRRWQLSNDASIPILRSRQASIGLSYKQNGWLFHGVGFFKLVKGITTQSQGFLDNYEFERVSGDYEAKGFDFLFSKQVGFWNTWLTYGFLESDYTFLPLKENPFRSNFDIRHAISSGLSFANQHFKISGGLNWRTGKPYTSTVPGNEIIDGKINFAATNNARVSDYLRFDVSALHSIQVAQNADIQVGFSIWNLLNKKNDLNSYYLLTSPQEEVQQIVQYSLGITPNAIFKIKFR
jgi:hypothetical protein